MTDQTTLNPPWIVRGDTVVDGDGVVVVRAPADADTEEGDARWQHRAARIAAVPLLIEACQGALRSMKGDDSDEEDALHNALVVSTGEAQGLDLFTMARRLETMTQHYKDARDVVKLREADVARHSARADAAAKELALVRGELEACKAAHLECEEELGVLKEAITEHARVLAEAEAALTPPSPAGVSAPASGSTPGASSATGSSSEAAASPSAHRGTPEWYWRPHDDVYAEGPYPTRDAAIADAKAYGYLRFHVGRCRHLHVGIGLDVDDKVVMDWYWSEAGEETIVLDEQEGGARESVRMLVGPALDRAHEASGVVTAQKDGEK